MSEKINRISRIRSLIRQDLASVDGRSTNGQSFSQAVDQPFNSAQNSLEQEKKEFEHYQLTQEARHQRLSKRQEFLRARDEERATRERQRQQAKAMKREHKRALREERHQRFRSGNIGSAPAGRAVSAGMRATDSSDVLLLTQLVQEGSAQAGQVAAPFSRRDPRSYSPFAHRASFSTSMQRGSASGLLFWLLNFLTAPFFLLWRVILSTYYFVISPGDYFPRARVGRFAIGSLFSFGHDSYFLRLLLGLWYFSTAPLHMLAHTVIDPLGIFTRKPHNYAHLPTRTYISIFAQQTSFGIRALPRLATSGYQSLAFFLLAPLLLLSRVVFSPYRYLRRFLLRVLSSGAFDRLDWLYRRTRIRTTRATQSFVARVATSSRKGGVSLRHRMVQFLRRTSEQLARSGVALKRRIVSDSRQLAMRLKAGEFSPREFLPRVFSLIISSLRRFLPRRFSHDGTFDEYQPPAFASLARARAVSGGEQNLARQAGVSSPLKAFQDFPFAIKGDAKDGDAREDNAREDNAREDNAREDNAREDNAREDNARDGEDRVGLLSKTEDTGLEDFLAANVDASIKTKAPMQAASQATPTADKEAIYREMDEISSHLRSPLRSLPPQPPPQPQQIVPPLVASEASAVANPPPAHEVKGSDAVERLFEDIDDLDADARAALLQRLSKQLEGDKLR